MQVLNCPQCGAASPFDPKSVWTSPGRLHGPQPGLPAPVVVQCPKCQQWVRVEVKDGGADVTQKQS
jgi:endogenous inhibitor of DNA gyrase (YacG/DUF329 family)